MSRIAIILSIVALASSASCVTLSSYKALEAHHNVTSGELSAERDYVATLQDAMEVMARQVGERDAKIGEYEENLAAMEQQVGAYKTCSSKLAALIEMGRLTISFRNGQVIINLPADVLFPSGRATLTEKGMASLNEVVKVLYAYKDRRFIVAGHTDNLKIAPGGSFPDNWILSQTRALNVVQYMVEQGFQPTSLAAAGYAENDPIADNSTAEGRAKNRRIEIILVPDLTEDMLPDTITRLQKRSDGEELAHSATK
jgi:chemotaxis protein MotB